MMKPHRLKFAPRGQALIMVMGVVLVASVVAFLVFNSGRAVNEKINLVNAADAAAYSGAQITARQLNFMAYTNRAMIANEVAIGHSLSFHMEVDLIRQVISAFNTLIPGANFLGAATEQLSSIISGIYMLAVDANTAHFSYLQESAFLNFASRNSQGVSVLEGAMQSVLSEYEMHDNKHILLNDMQTLTNFETQSATVPADIAQASQDARTMNQQFCRMVLFVNPSPGLASGSNDDVSRGNQMMDYCNALATSNSGSGAGSAGSPMLDQGVMLEMLQIARGTVDDAGWVRDRNHSYTKGTLLGTLTVTRTGDSDIVFQNGQLNWAANADTMNFRFRFNGLLGGVLSLFGLRTISTQANAAGDSVAISQQMGTNIDNAARALLRTAGLCDQDNDGDGAVDVSCNSLVGQSYRGVQKYTYLNSGAQTSLITAFLTQSRCADGIGVDKNGNEVQGWHNNLSFLDKNRDICNSNMYAVSQAQVYYERPQCFDGGQGCQFGFSSTTTGIERPNLFNPFWQARLQ